MSLISYIKKKIQKKIFCSSISSFQDMTTKKCTSCGERMLNTTEVCPKCGKDNLLTVRQNIK